MTQEALQEFRVSTSNYNADSGRFQRPAGVAGHPQWHQPVQRLRLLDVPTDGDAR